MRRFAFGLRIALRSLGAHRMRTALTMLGLVIGIAAVITTVAVGRGARQEVIDQLRSLGANLVLVSPGAARREGIQLEAGSSRSLSLRDGEAIEQNIPLVSALGAYITARGRVIAGNRNWSAVVSGVTPGYLAAREWPVVSGESLNAEHVDRASKVALIGRTVAEELFGGRNPVGRQVRLETTPFTVIGVLREKGRGPTGHDQDNTVFIPLSTAVVRVFGRSRARPEAVDGLLIKIHESRLIPRASREIRALLRQRHRILPGERDDFEIRDLTQIGETRKAAVGQFAWLVGIIASVSLLVGGVGIMNTMLVSVSERVREGGLHLALGAEPADLRNQFLVEAVLISLLGGAIGIGIGFAAAQAVREMLDWRVVVEFDSILLAVGVAVAIGVTFGLYPAVKAARMNPIEALRAE